MKQEVEIKDQFPFFPGTRYMGSKNKILPQIWQHLQHIEFDSILDAFGGSNVVGYFMKCKGKQVLTNDFLSFSYWTSKALIENSQEQITADDYAFLTQENNNNRFIERTFKDVFYSQPENAFLDTIRHNIDLLQGEYKKAIALSSLTRACAKKRSRGIFTFVGERYNDGRRDMSLSLQDHFKESIDLFNGAVFSNGKENQAYNIATEELALNADLVYLDPPYYNPKSDNDYTRRYHFLEGLVKNWENLEIQSTSLVKKFASYKSPFSRRESAYSAFENLLEKHKHSKIVISYSSNSYPDKEELTALLSKYKTDVRVHEIEHTYSFGNQNHMTGNVNNRVKEYLFIGC